MNGGGDLGFGGNRGEASEVRGWVLCGGGRGCERRFDRDGLRRRAMKVDGGVSGYGEKGFVRVSARSDDEGEFESES